MWIQNISRSDINCGFHIDPGPNCMLIQIVDPGSGFPSPKYNFRKTYQYEFLDLEKDDNPELEEFKITDEQASRIVQNLQEAQNNHMNVIVHCHAGICRSGAVCEVGIMMGFLDTEIFRSPNLLVKHKLMKCLGWTYD